MKIFLTGATGFIGQHLTHHLVSLGHQVVALVRQPQKAKTLPKTNVEFIQGDLDSFKNNSFQLPVCDYVIHLAGTVTANKQQDYDIINHQAVINLHQCLLKQSWRPKRLLFSSSLAASGPSKIDYPLDETQSESPLDEYGSAKLKAEHFLKNQTDIPVTIFRPCAVLGPRDPNTFNLYRIAKSGFGFVPAGPKQNLSFIGVTDLVEAIIMMLQETSSEHKTYFVAHNDIIDTHQLWHEVGSSLQKNIKLIKVPKPILFLVMQINTVFANLFDKPNVFDRKYYEQLKAPAWVCRSDKLQKDFGWTPKQSLKEIITETTQSYYELGWLK